MRGRALVLVVVFACAVVGPVVAQMGGGGGWSMMTVTGHVTHVAANHHSFQMTTHDQRITMHVDPYAPNPQQLVRHIGQLRPGQSVTVWCYSMMMYGGWYVSQFGGTRPAS